MFPLPLVVNVGPSGRLRLLLVVLHLLAGLALWLAALPLHVQTAGSVILLLDLAHSLRPTTSVTLRGTEKGLLEMRKNQEWRPLHDLGIGLLLPGIVLIRFQEPGSKRKRSLVILPDSMPADDYRRLRVWLQWLARRKDLQVAPIKSDSARSEAT